MKQPKGSPLDRFADFLLFIPSWVNITLGIIAYVLFEWLSRTSVLTCGNTLTQIEGAILAPVALCFFFLAAIVGGVHRMKRERLVDTQSGLQTLRYMDSKDFEYLVAEAYRRQGYSVDYTLGTGPDGGVDVVLKKDGRTSLVQCKCWKTWSVPVSVVREMFGIMHHEGADEVIVVSTGRFTEDSEAFAKGKAMQLVDGTKLWAMVREVQSGNQSAEMQPEPMTCNAPACPKCAGPMKLKMANTGPTAGQQFWGCLSFPVCRGNRSLDESLSAHAPKV